MSPHTLNDKGSKSRSKEKKKKKKNIPFYIPCKQKPKNFFAVKNFFPKNQK
jgi:hypothetical protein